MKDNYVKDKYVKGQLCVRNVTLEQVCETVLKSGSTIETGETTDRFSPNNLVCITLQFVLSFRWGGMRNNNCALILIAVRFFPPFFSTFITLLTVQPTISVFCTPHFIIAC